MILEGTPEAKAPYWNITDTIRRKLGERKGLGTPVVLAVNDEYSESEKRIFFGSQANALSIPPGEYARKCETQRN